MAPPADFNFIHGQTYTLLALLNIESAKNTVLSALMSLQN